MSPSSQQEIDLTRRQTLVKELLDLFLESSFDILGVEGIEGHVQPDPIENKGMGDQEYKSPDIYAFDHIKRNFVIGLAKTGKKDIASEHSLTQYQVFLNHVDPRSGNSSLLYIILPEKKIPDFNSLITHYIHPDCWENLILVSSKQLID